MAVITIRRFFFLALAAFAIVACGRSQPARGGARHVSIAAAADLKFALDELMAACRREHPEIELTATYGSSGNFYSQILNGAPFDLFLSADVEYPRQLADQQFVLRDSEFVYALGRLAIWVPSSSALDLSNGMQAVANASHVAIANPAHAPYGRAAVAAMRSAGVYDSVGTKLVYGENVGQALQFAQSGAADIGIVALALALAPPVKATGRYVEVPASLFPPIRQGGAIVKRTTDADAAWAVRAFLMSDEAASVLQRYGFGLPERR